MSQVEGWFFERRVLGSKPFALARFLETEIRSPPKMKETNANASESLHKLNATRQMAALGP